MRGYRGTRERNAPRVHTPLADARLTLPNDPMPSVLDKRYGPMRTAGPAAGGGPAIGGSEGAASPLISRARSATLHNYGMRRRCDDRQQQRKTSTRPGTRTSFEKIKLCVNQIGGYAEVTGGTPHLAYYTHGGVDFVDFPGP